MSVDPNPDHPADQPTGRPRLRRRLLRWSVGILVVILVFLVGIGIALRSSPHPGSWLVRHAFDGEAERTRAALAAHVPPDVQSEWDLVYRPGDPDGAFDIYWPANSTAASRHPVVVWCHGGAYVSGHRRYVGGYASILAARGYTVMCISYSIAPAVRYPTPVRQLAAALDHLAEHAARLRADMDRVVLAGDSAGAHLAAQVALTITDADYAARIGISPQLRAQQLAGLLLFCGPYDVPPQDRTAPVHGFLDLVMWAYAGRRDYADDDTFALANMITHASSALPPTFISAGNADPLLSHSQRLAARLGELGVPVDALFFPDDHEPPLNHEYQFNLDQDAGQKALERALAFLAAHTGPQ